MIPLYRPYMPDLPEMNALLHSGALAYGRYVKDFENKLRARFHTPYIIATNSFHTAISVAATTLGLTFGDEVIASPMACLASTQPYSSNGLSIRWCDIDPHRGTLDPDALSKRITPQTKAIIHNHFCGYPGYIDEINEIGRTYGIPVIDDGIECFGSEYKGMQIGCCGTDVAVFSFTAVRIPNTIDGGAVIFRDDALYEKSLRIRDCGIDRTIFRNEMGEINPDCDICEIGYSATMSNANGYIGSMQMEAVPELLSRQRSNAAAWDGVFSDRSDAVPLRSADTLPNYWVYGVLAKDKLDFIYKMRASGYYASGVHMNNNRYTVFGEYVPLPGVEDFYSRFVALPSGWWYTHD